ncbi:MAG: indole-3-glycerol phosphate synthase TrpC [Nitrospirae bacterium]|nr:MAG: Indole-3-glycerol-phosphate synthase [Leptospirillum sp. Group IV 'UBA BS']MCL4484747.1 indole-3-glycerol phosphate synthase TrpC [Nitrospirota bacterium]
MRLLEHIVMEKRHEVAAASRQRPLPVLEKEIFQAPSVRTFPPNPPLPDGRPRIIAEMKRKSPSRGLIRDPYDPVGLAESYRKGGASALSVLTDAPFFGGSLEDLSRVRRSPAGETLPILRKDFIIDPYQVWESRCAGADIVLLIVRILTREELRDLLSLIRDLRMTALVETHTEDEVSRALDAGAELVGINHRDLDTLTIDLDRGEKLACMIPAGVGKVAESGLRTNADYRRMGEAGFSAVLVGEGFLSSPDPSRALEEFRGTLG